MEQPEQMVRWLEEPLAQQVRLLAQERVRIAAAQAAINSLREEIAKTELGQALAKQEVTLAALRSDATVLDACIRSLAVEEYNKTGSKSPAPGIGIRVTKRLEYDEDVALEWARTNAPVLVVESLDKKGFEKLAPAEIVTVEECPTATIAKELNGI